MAVCVAVEASSCRLSLQQNRPFASLTRPKVCCRCHPTDEDHTAAACQEQCPQQLSCGHKCQDICGRTECPPCRMIVTVELDCGHEKEMMCSDGGQASQVCAQPAGIRMPRCHHQLEVPCGLISQVLSKWLLKSTHAVMLYNMSCPCSARTLRFIMCAGAAGEKQV